jgi:hypothetical protein
MKSSNAMDWFINEYEIEVTGRQRRSHMCRGQDTNSPWYLYSPLEPEPSQIYEVKTRNHVTLEIPLDALESIAEIMIRLEREGQLRKRHSDLDQQYGSYQALLGLISSMQDHRD